MQSSVAAPRALWLLFLAALAVLVPACSGIRLVSGYDETSEKELSSLYTETTSFVDRMISLRGTPEGTYANNQEFYTNAIARVDVLIARSQGLAVLGNCPSTRFIGAALDRTLPADLRSRLGEMPSGDCQTAVLQLLKGTYGDMIEFHRAQGDRGIPPSARDRLLEGGVGSVLRTAITIQAAKRAVDQGGE